MPELIIKYKDKKNLDVLMNFSWQHGIKVVIPSKSRKKRNFQIKGVTVIPADVFVDISGMEEIFSNKKN